MEKIKQAIEAGILPGRKEHLFEQQELEDKEYSVIIKFRPVKDDNGNIPKNATIQYSVDLGQAVGLNCNAVISAGMYLVETIIKHIENVKNEKDNLQLAQSEATTQNA